MTANTEALDDNHPEIGSATPASPRGIGSHSRLGRFIDRVRLRRVSSVWLCWGLVQCVWVAVVGFARTPTKDVEYYFHGLHPDLDPQATRSPSASLSEYPDAGVWPLRAIDVLTPTNSNAFLIGFVATIVLLSGLFLAFLIRLNRRWSASTNLDAPTFWVYFSAAAGPIVLTRLDLFPGLLVAVTAALLFTHPRIASALLGLATMSKLWPGVLASALVGRWNSRGTWARVGWFVGSLVAVAGITISTSGVERLLSPLTYQGDRGLQIESIAATPMAFLNAFARQTWIIDYASSKSYEIFGPGVSIGITVSNMLMLATIALALFVALLRFFRGGWSPEAAATLLLLLAVLLIVSNKVFSPQYLMWFGPTLAVLIATLVNEHHRRYLGGIAVVAVLIAALTTTLYPFLYSQLVFDHNPIAALILAIRNVLILCFAGLCARLALRTALKS